MCIGDPSRNRGASGKAELPRHLSPWRLCSLSLSPRLPGGGKGRSKEERVWSAFAEGEGWEFPLETSTPLAGQIACPSLALLPLLFLLPRPFHTLSHFTLHTSHFTLHARSHARHSCTWTPPRQGFPSFPCLLQPRTTPLNGRSTTSTACLLLLRLMMRNNNKAAQTQSTTTSPTTIQQQQQQQQHLRRRNNRSSLRGTGLRATSRRGNGASST